MSLCKYCFKNIIWIQNPNGSWNPPFDDDGTLTHLEYIVTWDDTALAWQAVPANKEVSAVLKRHDCRAYEEAQVKPEPVKDTYQEHIDAHNEFRRQLPIVEYVYRPTMPEPDRLIALSKRLTVKCPICGAEAFEWCFYIRGDQAGTFTKILHAQRQQR
jgi:hypothetical protein